MPTSESIQAFISYAHLDWQADADEFTHLTQQLEAQTKTEGLQGFALWRDQERLKWGNKWSEALEQAIAASHLFFIFLSPSWLDSTVCRQEFDTFRQHEATLGGARIFVAQIRDLDEVERHQHSAVLAELNRLQAKFWQDLLVGDSDLRKRACKAAAKDIKARWRQLTGPGRPVTPACAPTPPPVSAPLVTGDFAIGQHGADHSEFPCFLQVNFTPKVRVTTTEGTLEVSAKWALLRIRAEGATIAPHPEFLASNLPSVSRIGGSDSHNGIYQIVPIGGVLSGNVLAKNPNEGHVPVLTVRRSSTETVRIEGEVTLDTSCIEARPLDGQTDEALKTMQKRLADLVLKELGCIHKLGEVSA